MQTNIKTMIPMVILTMGSIVFVTAEILPVGILSEISNSFSAPIGKVGLMVTGYAWAVAISAVFITRLLSNMDRRNLLLIITLLFFLANLFVAITPSLNGLYIARIVAAFSHGVFWSIIGPLCVRLSVSTNKAKATGLVFGGIAIASVIAVPLGVLLTQWVGWRMAFLALAIVSLAIAIAVWLFFPRLPSENRTSLKQIGQLLFHPFLQRLYPATILALTGHFCAFTYIAFILEKMIQIPHQSLAFYLFLFGISGFIANLIVGIIPDQYLRMTSQWDMWIMAIVIVLCTLIPKSSFWMAAIVMVIWGAGIAVLTVTLQSLILTLPTHLMDIASAVHVSCFNIGIGSGALIGGIIADSYGSAQFISWASGTVLIIAGFILMTAPYLKNSLKGEQYVNTH